MNIEEAKSLAKGDRLRWAKDERDNQWREVIRVEARGVVVTHIESGVDIGHRELFDWTWLTQSEYPYSKI